MANLKETSDAPGTTVTMTANEINYLSTMHAYIQQELDTLMERMAGMYLNHLAVAKFGMDGAKDYHFEFHPDREFDNLTIREKQ